MTVAPVIGPVQRPSDDRDFSEIFRRLNELDRSTRPPFPSFSIGLFLNKTDPDELVVQETTIGAGTIAATWYIPAGGIIAVEVVNFDGADHNAVLIGGFVQQIGATTREACSGNVVNVPAQGSALLTWDFHLADSVILDRTDPELPTVGASAVYAVSIFGGISL